MSHSSFDGHGSRKPPYSPKAFKPRAAEHGAGQHLSSNRPAKGSRSGNPTRQGGGRGGYTDGKPVKGYL